MKNDRIATMFRQMADVMEFQGDNPFKINAYRKAARIIKDLQDDIESVWKEDRLKSLPGVGEALSKKIDEFLRTGRMAKYEEIIKMVSDGILELLKIPSLEPKTVALIHRELGVENRDNLKRVIQDGTLAQLTGMGQKKIEIIHREFNKRDIN
jgi:DNA polymerase (family 10)